MLVSVLPPFPGSREPFHTDVFVPDGCVWGVIRVDDCDGYGAGMGSAPFFGWGHSLDPVATGLVIKGGQVFAGHFDEKLSRGTVQRFLLSPASGAELGVGVRQFTGEEIAVFTTLGWPDFDDALHVGLHAYGLSIMSGGCCCNIIFFTFAFRAGLCRMWHLVREMP